MNNTVCVCERVVGGMFGVHQSDTGYCYETDVWIAFGSDLTNLSNAMKVCG